MATTSAGDGPPPDGMETVTYLCTGCPLGCRLEVDAVDDEVVEVRGFRCKRGLRYGTQEHTDPRREVATTVWLSGGDVQRLPVRAATPVPKASVRAFVRALAGVEVTAPISLGSVVAEDVAGTGIDAVATRGVPPPGAQPSDRGDRAADQAAGQAADRTSNGAPSPRGERG